MPSEGSFHDHEQAADAVVEHEAALAAWIVARGDDIAPALDRLAHAREARRIAEDEQRFGFSIRMVPRT